MGTQGAASTHVEALGGHGTLRDSQAPSMMFSPVRPLVTFGRRLAARVDAATDAQSGVEIQPAANRGADGIPRPGGGTGTVEAVREIHAYETALGWLASLAGAVGVALMFPITILAVGLPVAIAGRTVLALIEWLVALVPR